MDATAIFDIGKTNKKFIVFDKGYTSIHEEQVTITEIKDDDGDPVDDLKAIEDWMYDVLERALARKEFEISKLNFSTYGATLVNLGENGKPVTPMYNYLKPYPSDLLEKFLEEFGGHESFCLSTSSPLFGMLNSGLQLYWLKNNKPLLFEKIVCSLHLPQYLSYLFTGKMFGEFTSVGCHSGLWDFANNNYHDWTHKSGIFPILPEIKRTGMSIHSHWKQKPLDVGLGIHDTSANLVPYLKQEKEPFMLLSTGTWSLVLNPFNDEPLTYDDLQNDCLNFLKYDGNPVKVARLFLGNEYQLQVEEMSKFFNKSSDYHQKVKFDTRIFNKLKKDAKIFSLKSIDLPDINKEGFTDLRMFESFEIAYHQLMIELMEIQLDRINLAMGKGKVSKLFVDGGFVENGVFMSLLKINLPGIEIVPGDQIAGSARGAAMMMRS